MGKMYNELKKFFTVPSVLTGIAVSLVLFWVLPLLLPDNINQPPDYTSFYQARADVEYETLLTRANGFIQGDKDFTEKGITDYRSFFMGVQARISYLANMSEELAEMQYEEYCNMVQLEDEPVFSVRLSKEAADKLYEKAYGFPYDGQIFSYYQNHLEIPEEPYYTFLLLQTYNDGDTGLYAAETSQQIKQSSKAYRLFIENRGATNLTQEQYYSNLPKLTFTNYLRLLRNIFLAVAMGLATVMLLSRNVAETKNLRALQYVTRTGKHILYYKIAALLLTSFSAALVMLALLFINGTRYGFTEFPGGYINNSLNQSAAIVPIQMNFSTYILMSFVCMFLMTFFICLLSLVFDSFIHNGSLRFFMLIPMGALSYWLITFMTDYYPEDPHETLVNLSLPLCEIMIPLILCGIALAAVMFLQKKQVKDI